MLVDGINLVEGSEIANITVATGSFLPGTPNNGELFYLTTGTIGLYVYDASKSMWNQITASTGNSGLFVTQNIQTANYTTILSDIGKQIYHPASDNNARTFTIDSNASVAYPIGTAISFINMAAANVTISITTDTMYLSGAGTTGSRTLAQYGVATALKLDATTWIISGNGLT